MSRRRKVEREIEPSRILKLKECCDMLLAAGYFRARLQTLSPFDKVVGGMVWSITASGVDVGVDILFQENSTIGERIKLCETLVKAMISMKCPLPLQSHQIQGLDYDNLFPVLQWLVKKVIETRRLTGDLVRQLSMAQFENTFALPEEHLSEAAEAFVSTVGGRYQPERKYKRPDSVQLETLTQRTEATLLEYGEKLFGAVVFDEEKQDRKREREEQRSKGKNSDVAVDEKEMEAVRVARQEEEARLQAMQAQLSSDGAAVSVGGASVGNILTMQAAEIQRAQAEYDEEMKNLELSGVDAEEVQRRKVEVAHERQMEAFRKKIKQEEGVIELKKPLYQEFATKVKELQAAADKQKAYVERINVEMAKLDEIEANTANKDVLNKLKHLVFLNESLKAQEAQFKATATAQRAELQGLLKDLSAGENDEETKRMLEIERLYDADLTRLQKIREALALKNQEIAKVTRAIDDVPTRAELLQYERRFVELYELVQGKLVETRKYYEFYNTLNDTFQYMTNEDQLLMSIIEGFPKAMKSSQKGKDSFLASFGGILENVGQNKSHVEKELDGETSTRDVLNAKYTKLLEKQRKYFKCVKEFQEECFKNEKLTESYERYSRKG